MAAQGESTLFLRELQHSVRHVLTAEKFGESLSQYVNAAGEQAAASARMQTRLGMSAVLVRLSSQKTSPERLRGFLRNRCSLSEKEFDPATKRSLSGQCVLLNIASTFALSFDL